MLQIGDSLIRKIADAITEGDFLIAVVSPDSIESEWCQTELALARRQGINEQRVKVLPVRFRGASMPPMLGDAYWGDADSDDVETISRRLAASIRAHNEGRESEADREAEGVQRSGRAPTHAEQAGDVVVVQLEDVAQRVFDVAEAWADVHAARANVREVENHQRRLRWAFEALPDHVRSGLPLVAELSTARVQHFVQVDPEDAEDDIREEMLSVRRQVAQGLPVSRRWTIVADLGSMSAGNRDATAHAWQIARGDESQAVVVYISRTAMASYNETLPLDVPNAKETNGRAVVSNLLSLDEPPPEVMVSTAGIGWPLPS